MALTVETGPFGNDPAGHFNFAYDPPPQVLYFEDSPRRVRAVVAGETIAESDHVKLLHESGRMPVYYFPEADVRQQRLEPSEHVVHDPSKGPTVHWTIRVGDQVRTDAARAHPDPPAGAPALAGHVAFAWHAVDEWWEEAERVRVHARDPYHRCDAVRSDRHVVVRVGGQVVADSRRPTLLFETSLPPRFYLPEADVHMELLTPTGTVTECPYKGTTSQYYTVEAGGRRVEDLAWVYAQPRDEVRGIAGLLAFYNEKVDLEVDGERWERPHTKFS